MNAVPAPSALSPSSPAGRAADGHRSVLRSATARVTLAIAAAALVLGVAALGLVRATEQTAPDGVSLGVAASRQSVVVRNGRSTALAGELIVTAGARSTAISVRLPAQAHRAVAIAAAGAGSCRGVVTVRLLAPGAPVEAVELPCANGSTR